MRLTFIVNNKQQILEVPGDKRLIDILRDDLGLTGTKEGCGEGECGACTVIMDGKAVPSCMILACQSVNSQITTIEGIGTKDNPHVLQQAFVESGAVQCGFCIPGFILTAKAYLEEEPNPTRESVRKAIAGNLCRCTGYEKIIDAIMLAAERLRK